MTASPTSEAATSDRSNRTSGGSKRASDPSRGESLEGEMSKPTLLRWLTENRADTRLDGPPEGRRYSAPFARVWDVLVGLVEQKPRWTLQHSDELEGILTVTCRSRLFRFVDDLTIWVALDGDGLTRVEARSRSRTGRGDFGVNRRRVERILERLDEVFGRV